VQRAEDKTASMQARAGAIDELLASGALDDVTGTAKDDITVELDRLASTNDVELELARMKQEITTGPAEPPRQIEGQAEPAAEAVTDSVVEPQPAPRPEEGRS
jgi:phage shock protein A